MRPTTVLLLSGDPLLVASCRKTVGRIHGLELATAADLAEAGHRLDREEPALVLAHLRQQKDAVRIAALLRRIASEGRAVPVVVLGEQHSVRESRRLLRLGAADFLRRPLDLNRLAYLMDTLTARACYGHRPPGPGGPPPGAGEPGAFIYLPSGPLALLMEQVGRVAPQPTTVLLNGETGTGKTRLARLIHDLSPNRDLPCLVVSCGALSANLIESEMFGHVKGAFTGAERDRVGKFAEAGNGTLLLDEVDALPLALQAKLLRAVEERLFEPVGSNKSLPLRARLLVASNRMLENDVEAGRFRADLYFRLAVVSFYLPPLRERPGVVPAMVAAFVEEFAARNGRPVRRVSAAALRALEDYGWPGNVRELRNVIERAVALCLGDEVQLGDLPPTVASPAGTGLTLPTRAPSAPASRQTLGQAKEQLEAARILEALRKHANNRLRAAVELGISRMTLYTKLRKYGLLGARATP